MGGALPDEEQHLGKGAPPAGWGYGEQFLLAVRPFAARARRRPAAGGVIRGPLRLGLPWRPAVLPREGARCAHRGDDRHSGAGGS